IFRFEQFRKTSQLIHVYTVKNKELIKTDVRSKRELDNIVAEVKRGWVDCSDMDEKERRVVSDLLGVEATSLNGIENGKTRPHYAKCFDEMCPYYAWIATPVVEFTDELNLHPMSIILKERFLVTLRSKHSERLIESTLRTFKALPPEKRKPTVILSKLVHEKIDENSSAMVSLRDHIDSIEEKPMEGAKKKTVTN